MTRVDSDRGVSTVADVTLALLLITASVMIVGYFLAGDSTVERTGPDAPVAGHSHGDVDGRSAAQTTGVLSESTISVTYSIEDIRDEEAFSEPVVTNEHTYTRTDHGSPLGLMADAALTNHQIGGAPGERCSPLWDHVGPDVDRDDVEAQDDCLG